MAYTTIDKPSDYFNTKLTTGTGSSQAVTGLGFQPDWIWGKRRDSTGHHTLFDSVRGITKGLESNSTGAEFTSTDYYSSFDSDGFTIAAGAAGAGNGSSQTAVQWCWKAGGSASSNSNGSITSSVSASTDAGFSIVGWTGNNTNGATVGHGLGVTPDVVFFKNRSGPPNSWHVYHSSFANATDLLLLDGTNAIISSNNYISGTRPSSSLLTLGNSAATNENSETIIAYCFAEKKGYSKFGSYVGNGSTSGTYVHLGFKPAWVMVKDSSNAGYNWMMYDNKRLGYNGGSRYLIANENYAESGSSDNLMDFTSNGFKLRIADQNINRTHTYIYMAFAESPFVNSNGVPNNAR